MTEWIERARRALAREEKRIEEDPSRLKPFQTENWKGKTEDPPGLVRDENGDLVLAEPSA